MRKDEFSTLLEQTLEDHKLSRSEKREIADAVSALGGDEHQLGLYRSLAFEKAAVAARTGADVSKVLEWLEKTIKVLIPQSDEKATLESEAHFSPNERTARRLASFLSHATRTLDICVFTITDDRISREIVNAHKKNVKVRIITDDEKAHDLGSDVEEFRQVGIPVRMDDSTFHMHHKFAIADGRYLLTGSYNWTRSASQNNQENFLIINDPKLISEFSQEFEKLWEQFSR